MHSGARQLHCTEIWGGNRPTDTALSIFGMDAWVYSHPHQGDSGGDVYYLTSCSSGQISRVVVADVAGHGEVVADIARHLRRLMHRYIMYHSQKRLVRAINARFARTTPDGEFATAVVVTFDALANRMLLTNAGHPPPLHYDIKAGRWQLLENRPGSAAFHDGNPGSPARTAAGPGELVDVPLGIEPAVRYDEVDIQLNVGDLVLCYTDSLTDAMIPSGERLGPRGLLKQVADLNTTDPDQLIPALRGRIASLDPRNLLDDDVTLLLFRPNGQRTSIPLRDLAMAPFRAVRAVAGSYVGQGT